MDCPRHLGVFVSYARTSNTLPTEDRKRPWAVLACVAALVFAGCSGGAEPCEDCRVVGGGGTISSTGGGGFGGTVPPSGTAGTSAGATGSAGQSGTTGSGGTGHAGGASGG